MAHDALPPRACCNERSGGKGPHICSTPELNSHRTEGPPADFIARTDLPPFFLPLLRHRTPISKCCTAPREGDDDEPSSPAEMVVGLRARDPTIDRNHPPRSFHRSPRSSSRNTAATHVLRCAIDQKFNGLFAGRDRGPGSEGEHYNGEVRLGQCRSLPVVHLQ